MVQRRQHVREDTPSRSPERIEANENVASTRVVDHLFLGLETVNTILSLLSVDNTGTV